MVPDETFFIQEMKAAVNVTSSGTFSEDCKSESPFDAIFLILFSESGRGLKLVPLKINVNILKYLYVSQCVTLTNSSL